MSRPACITCPFYYREHNVSGQCRRYPPTVYGDVSFADRASYEPEAIVTAASSRFPAVGDDDWCGEHPEFERFRRMKDPE